MKGFVQIDNLLNIEAFTKSGLIINWTILFWVMQESPTCAQYELLEVQDDEVTLKLKMDDVVILGYDSMKIFKSYKVFKAKYPFQQG